MLAPRKWSNSLIIGMYPTPSAWRHVLNMSAPYKNTRKLIWKYHLRNDSHFVSPPMHSLTENKCCHNATVVVTVDIDVCHNDVGRFHLPKTTALIPRRISSSSITPVPDHARSKCLSDIILLYTAGNAKKHIALKVNLNSNLTNSQCSWYISPLPDHFESLRRAWSNTVVLSAKYHIDLDRC